jgi:hypothetical protein
MTHPQGKPKRPGAMAPPVFDPSAGQRSAPLVAVRPDPLLMSSSFQVRANDEPGTRNAGRSPLWIIVVGVVWLLGVAASVLVVSGAYTDGFEDEDGFGRPSMPIEMHRGPADMPTQDSGIKLPTYEDSRP